MSVLSVEEFGTIEEEEAWSVSRSTVKVRLRSAETYLETGTASRTGTCWTDTIFGVEEAAIPSALGAMRDVLGPTVSSSDSEVLVSSGSVLEIARLRGVLRYNSLTYWTAFLRRTSSLGTGAGAFSIIGVEGP